MDFDNALIATQQSTGRNEAQRRQFVALRNYARLAHVDLYRALGGGWVDAAAAQAPQPESTAE